MNSQVDAHFRLVERQLSLFRLLARQLVDCRAEFVGMDLDGIYKRVAEQEELCRRIEALCPSGMALSQGEESTDDRKKLPLLIRELSDAQAEVHRLNQVQAAYLRRSRKTVDILIRALESTSGIYGPPPEGKPPVAERSE
jgi:hypothetical protein